MQISGFYQPQTKQHGSAKSRSWQSRLNRDPFPITLLKAISGLIVFVFFNSLYLAGRLGAEGG